MHRLRYCTRCATSTLRPVRRTTRERTRLSPGDTAPDFTLTTDTGEQVSLSGPARPQGDRVLLPGRDDPGLHQAGLRLHRLPRLAARPPATRCSASPRTSRPSWRSSASATALTITLLSDPDKAVLTAYGAFGEKKLYGKVVEGVIRSTFVVDEDGQGRAGAVQRQGHRPRRQAAPGPRPRLLDSGLRARSPMAEAVGLGPAQCEFESHRAHSHPSRARA